MIPTRGITTIAREDIDYGFESGYRIKLLASAKKSKKGIYTNVEPVLIPASHPLASVYNEFNAVFVKGNAVDSLMFYGRGAGSLPTGSAVLGDVIGIARKLAKGAAYDVVPQIRYDSGLRFIGEGISKYYVRMTVTDKPGVLGRITTTFGQFGVSVEAVKQNAPYESDGERIASLFFRIFEVERPLLYYVLNKLHKENIILSVDNIMRIED